MFAELSLKQELPTQIPRLWPKLFSVTEEPLIIEHRAACCTWIHPSGEVETQLQQITEQATCLRKMTPSMGSLTGLETMASKYPANIAHYLIIIIIIFLVHYILSKILNACLQLLTTKQMVSPRLNQQKGQPT